jgi:hypothetical protein
MALTPLVVTELAEQAKNLLELWMKIRMVFVRAFGTQEITKEQEDEYLNLKGEVQSLYRAMSNQLTLGLKFDGDKMAEILKNATSMDLLRQQTAPERQKLFAIWHQIYVKLTRTLGALEIMNAGYFPHEHRALMASEKK